MTREDRPAHIPDIVMRGEKVQLGRPTLKDLQEQHGGAGVFNFPKQEHFLLDNPDWRYD
jgi:hypothetical protein